MINQLRMAPLALLLSGATAAQIGPPLNRGIPSKVDRIFARWDSTVSPGCALAVFKDARIVYKRGYGMADLDHDVPIRPESVFHVASISKQFTATAIVLLVQEGKISLDDDVRKYIPELPDFGTRITIRHLIYHTSGLRDQWSLLGLAGWRYSLDLITDDDVLQLVSNQKELNFPPGEKHLYCNTGYTLLAQIVKRVSGHSLREFTESRIFLPLGMKNTHFRDDHAEVVKRMAYGYVRGPGGSFRLSVTNFDTVGATSLLTTVEDLALWDRNFYDPRVGGAALISQLLQRGKLNSGKELSYAFGLSLGSYRGLTIVDHSGDDAGYRADLLRFPEQHFSVACLCNLADTNPSQLARKVADIFLESEFKEPVPEPLYVKTVSLSEQELDRFVGLYWNAEDEQAIRIRLQQGKLAAMRSEGEAEEMKPTAANRFRLEGAPIDLEFTKTSGGSIQMSFQPFGAPAFPVFEAVQEFRPDQGQLAAYAGAYRSAEIESIYRIALENGVLVLKRLKSKPASLNPTITDFFSGPFGSLHFLRNPQGQVSGFLLDAGRVRGVRFEKEP